MLKEFLQNRLKELNMTPSELARRTKQTPQNVSRQLHGRVKRLQPASVPIFADALGVSTDDLEAAMRGKKVELRPSDSERILQAIADLKTALLDAINDKGVPGRKHEGDMREVGDPNSPTPPPVPPPAAALPPHKSGAVAPASPAGGSKSRSRPARKP